MKIIDKSRPKPIHQMTFKSLSRGDIFRYPRGRRYYIKIYETSGQSSAMCLHSGHCYKVDPRHEVIFLPEHKAQVIIQED